MGDEPLESPDPDVVGRRPPEGASERAETPPETKLPLCPMCGAAIPRDAVACPQCGELLSDAAKRAAEAIPGDDCPLPVASQLHNIRCFAAFWCVYYLAAPVTYVGPTHANLLKALGHNDAVANLPHAAYQWLTVVPVLAAWFFPRPGQLKPLALVSLGAMAVQTAIVAGVLWRGASREATTAVVIAHGAVFGAANGVMITALWDILRRGVSTSRRGRALGLTFGVGPLFACVGSLLQDSLFKGSVLKGFSLGLEFPLNYLAMFATVVPLLFLVGLITSAFRLPQGEEPERDASPLDEIVGGIRQFVRNRAVLTAVGIYILVYSGGNAIFDNVSLHTKDLLGDKTDTLGLQMFLRFGFKAVAGACLGWLLTKTNPRATLLATTGILLAGMGWALTSTGWWFLLTAGLLGAGELFGAHFPNYVATASPKPNVRTNMAYLNVLGAVIGFASVGFGLISERYGRIASFYAAAGILVVSMALIVVTLPRDPTPRETLP